LLPVPQPGGWLAAGHLFCWLDVVPGIRFGDWLVGRAVGADWEIGAPMSGGTSWALVTGASAGIGRACAEELHAAGWAVTGPSRRGTTSGGWAGLVMDVDDDDSVRTGVAGMLAAGGRMEGLFVPLDGAWPAQSSSARLRRQRPSWRPTSGAACGWCSRCCPPCGRKAAGASC